MVIKQLILMGYDFDYILMFECGLSYNDANAGAIVSPQWVVDERVKEKKRQESAVFSRGQYSGSRQRTQDKANMLDFMEEVDEVIAQGGLAGGIKTLEKENLR